MLRSLDIRPCEQKFCDILSVPLSPTSNYAIVTDCVRREIENHIQFSQCCKVLDPGVRISLLGVVSGSNTDLGSEIGKCVVSLIGSDAFNLNTHP